MTVQPKIHLIIPDGYNIMRDGTIYSVNRYIHVKNRWGSTTLRYLKAKKIEFWTTKSGYKKVSLGSNFKADVHRLVAEKFIPNPLGLPQVNHKDGNKGNNNLENLEFITKSENTRHALKNGLFKPNFDYIAIRTRKKVKQINKLKNYSKFDFSSIS
jgi:hypothetical protein